MNTSITVIDKDTLEFEFPTKYIFNERRTGNRISGSTKIRLKKFFSDGQDNITKYIVVELKAKGIYDKSEKQKDKIFLGTLEIPMP